MEALPHVTLSPGSSSKRFYREQRLDPGDGEERGGQIRVALAQGDEVWAIQNPSRPSAEDVSCWGSRRGRAGGQRSSGKDPSTIEIHQLQTRSFWVRVLVAPSPGNRVSALGAAPQNKSHPLESSGLPTTCKASAERSEVLVASSGTRSRRREGKGSKLC